MNRLCQKVTLFQVTIYRVIYHYNFNVTTLEFLYRILLMKLQFKSAKELSGRTKLWYRSRRVYTHEGFVCRRPYRTCEWLERICENRSLSDFSQRAANVGESSEQKPERMLLLKTPSSRSRSEAVVKPHQAGDAYNNRERIIDLNTWSRPASFSPCARRVLRANNARAQVETVSSICWDTENLLEMVTPNIFIDSERTIPGIRAGGVIVRLLLGLEKIISTVLELFRVRLFLVAHSLMYYAW